MPRASSPPTNLTRLRPGVRLAVGAVAGPTLGVLTAYAQQWLPSELGSLETALLAVAVSAITAAAFVAVYSQDLDAVLP